MIKKVIIYFSAVSLFSSCMTSFRISVQKPALINLPNAVNKILVIDDTPKGKVDIESAVEGIFTGEQVNGDKVAAETFLSGLTQSLQYGKYHAEKSHKIVARDGKQINAASLDSLFRENEAQAVIVLQKFDSDAPIGGVVVGNVLGQTQITLIGRATISIYCQNQLRMEDILVTERFIIPTSGSVNPLAMLQDVVNRQKWYSDLGHATGALAGSYFYSPWVWVNRNFYNKGSKGLRQAKKMIRYGNWDIAEKQLAFLLNSPKGKVKARASYNLGLVYEGQGRLEDAISMVERSALEFYCKKAPRYLQQLKRRLNEVRLIEWQKQN